MKTIGIIVIMGLSTIGSFYLKNEPESLEQESKTFEERLRKSLNSVEANCKLPNKYFGINFSNDRNVIFQIINRNLLENSVGNDFGYGLHLSFDDSFPETKEELERFKKSGFADKFKFYIQDGILTYQLDLKMDKEKIIKLAKKIIKVVY